MRRLTIVLSLLIALVQLASAGRYYDARTGRFLQLDAKAHRFPGWSQYNYALNNPLRNIDPDGQEVKVYTERLGSATLYRNAHSAKELAERTIAYLYGPRHAFMRVTTDKVDIIIELGGPKEGNKKGEPLMEPVGTEMETRLNQEEHTVNRPQGAGEKDYDAFENRIIGIFNTIKENLPDYDALTGPNSNGFIKFLIETAGGGVELPSKATGKDEIRQYWDQYQKSLEEKKREDEKNKQH